MSRVHSSNSSFDRQLCKFIPLSKQNLLTDLELKPFLSGNLSFSNKLTSESVFLWVIIRSFMYSALKSLMFGKVLRCCHVQTEKQYKFSVCILYLVCILYPVCSLHFVLTGLILLFWFKQASSPDRNIEARKKILVILSWPLWLMCELYIEELPRKSTII